MPFRSDRLQNLRKVKGWSKDELAERAGLSRPMITKTERDKNSPRSKALDQLAEALDCTTDYLLGRGPDYKTPAVAAARMAFDVFVSQQDLTNAQRESCRRALPHPDAPKTAQAWRSLAQMLELAIGQSSSTAPLALVQQHPKSKPMAVARRPDR